VYNEYLISLKNILINDTYLNFYMPCILLSYAPLDPSSLTLLVIIHILQALALHTAQSQIEPTAPDFWEKVCTEMERTGYHRTSAECRDEWFQVLNLINSISLILCVLPLLL
jgi:hypothetical protein